MFGEVISTCRKAGFLPKSFSNLGEDEQCRLAVERGLGGFANAGIFRGLAQ